MISRRSFLKVSGLAAVALSTGYGAGKLANNSENNFFAVHGFIPADENILRQLIASFTEQVKSSADPLIFADARHTSIIDEAYKKCSNSLERGVTRISLSRISSRVEADILIADGHSAILQPESFNYGFSNIRSQLKNKTAHYFLSAEFKPESILSSLLKANDKKAVIENEKGIVDKIDLNKSYKNIIVKGPYGETQISVDNGSIGINSASCRNQICKHSGNIFETGQLIACAPNQVIIRIETV